MTTTSPMSSPSEELRQWFQICCFQKFGPAILTTLMNATSAPEILESSAEKLAALGIDGRIAREFVYARQEDQWKRQYERMESEGIQMMIKGDRRYPELLKHIHHPPVVLFWKGTVELNWRSIISVVGTRLISAYGKQITKP